MPYIKPKVDFEKQHTIKSRLFLPWDSLGINKVLICRWLIGDDFRVLSVLGPHLIQTCASPVHTASISMSSYELYSCWFSGPCFLGVLQPLWHSSYLLSLSFPEPWGEKFDGDIKMSHFLHIIWQWVSVFVPILCRKLLWWWLHKTLLSEYSRKSLRVILLPRSIGKTVYFVFVLDLLDI